MRLIQFVVIVAVMIFSSGPLLACSCARPTKSATEMLKDGAIVVRGIATSEDVSSQQHGRATYRFKVSHAVNAKAPNEIVVWSRISSAACGARLKVGAVSVVLLHGSKADGYWFGSCGQYAVRSNLKGWNALLDSAQ